MKAVRIHCFGGPQVLTLEEIDIPRPRAGEVLVRIAAASINPVDYKIRAGHFPQISATDLPVTLGRDVSGEVVGTDGPREVMALLDWTHGGYAEYALVAESLCVPKPQGLSAVEAAAVPLAALTAWQGLFQHANLQQNQRVLIHAGAGGVGHFAVQFAVQRGARVFSTASSGNCAFVEELGADRVIDYTRQRFEDELADLDVVFDLVGGETQDRTWRVLRPGGILVSTVGQPDARRAAAHRVRAMGYLTEPNATQLQHIGTLIEAGMVRPVLTRTFALAEAGAAQEYVERVHPRGKVALAVRDAALSAI